MLRSVLLVQRPDWAGDLAILPVGPVPGHSLPNYTGLNAYVHTCVHACVACILTSFHLSPLKRPLALLDFHVLIYKMKALD